MTSKSKLKGNRWENEVAKFLSECYKETFVRIPTSGAFTGGKNSYRRDILTEYQYQAKRGDIQPPDEWMHFNCEAKNYGHFNFHQLFTHNSLLDNWISQLLDVEQKDDVSILFIKISNVGRYICVKARDGFVVNQAMQYNGWLFCHWDEFWHDDNIRLLKRLSTK